MLVFVDGKYSILFLLEDILQLWHLALRHYTFKIIFFRTGWDCKTKIDCYAPNYYIITLIAILKIHNFCMWSWMKMNYIKIVELNETYNFVVDKFSFYTILNAKNYFWILRILNSKLEFSNLNLHRLYKSCIIL